MCSAHWDFKGLTADAADPGSKGQLIAQTLVGAVLVTRGLGGFLSFSANGYILLTEAERKSESFSWRVDLERREKRKGAKRGPNGSQKRSKWRQKAAKMRQGTFQNTLCGTGAKR